MYKTDERLQGTGGIQSFTIHGELYHLQGPLHAPTGAVPSFAQLYFYDPHNAAITAVKLSILLLYRRIFPNARLKVALCAVGGFVICCGLTMNLLVAFQCTPINASWNPTVVGHCIHLNTAFIIFGSLNALTGKGGYEMMKEQLTIECNRSHCLMPTHAVFMAASNR